MCILTSLRHVGQVWPDVMVIFSNCIVILLSPLYPVLPSLLSSTPQIVVHCHVLHALTGGTLSTTGTFQTTEDYFFILIDGVHDPPSSIKLFHPRKGERGQTFSNLIQRRSQNPEITERRETGKWAHTSLSLITTVIFGHSRLSQSSSLLGKNRPSPECSWKLFTFLVGRCVWGNCLPAPSFLLLGQGPHRAPRGLHGRGAQ